MTNNLSSKKAFKVIAIDGGAASGKSSTSKRLAEELNLLHVDTGAHYRAVAYACQQAGIAPTDAISLKHFLSQLVLRSHVVGRESYISFNDQPPPGPELLRSENINRCVSPYAALPVVRETVKAYQRGQVDIAKRSGFDGIVMDGRDIGTVILPEAEVKVFLVADTSTREKRRVHEGGVDAIADRDKTDSSRSVAPLRPAEDAVVIDNSDLSLEEVVDKILQIIRA
ncbi:(d)CMP kinase [Puniceicoccales bacterium CK1056]|uniref:Cytidylate kinase n=1 Tax=Oceanipulchritudo coccoides TaxID=2706888 RepID=A0A6B2M1L4_9BACT|nr:(d)CMP kinase [Oceanipulchritudo coccoides]NDV62024.1 (d)CMP kinase [Oceanipulchritudo coccoides]